MALNAAGEMIQAEWEQLPQRFAHVQFDSYVAMHNHFHGIIILTQPFTKQTICSTPQSTVPLNNIVGAFKSMTTTQYIKGVRQNGWPPFPGRLWHLDYWEHIVRTEAALHSIRAYIEHNPRRWHHNDLH